MGLGRCAAALGISWLALVAASAPPPLEDGVLTEINYVRTHPHEYADELRRYRYFFDGRVLHLPGDEIGVMTREGTVAVDEAISFLDRQAPLHPLDFGEVLALAAHDLADEQGETGNTGHSSANGESPGQRVKRRGGGAFVGETISYGYDDAGAVVRQLVIDDGVPGRGHRSLVFAADSRYAGVGCGRHPRDGFLCVIDYSTTPNGAPALPKFVAAGR